MADTDTPIEEVELTPASPPITEHGLSPSPYNFLFTGEDHLRVTSFNSKAGVVVAIQGRMWSPRDGIKPFGQIHVPNTDRTARSELFAMGEGYLLNLSVFPQSGSPIEGQTFVRVQVVRGFSGATYVLGTLVQDYITSGQDVAWPGSPIRRASDGNGYARTIEGTAPGAGNEVVETVPPGASWEIASIQLELTTSAVAAVRRVLLYFSDVVSELWGQVSAANQQASQVQKYYFAVGISFADYDSHLGAIVMPLPARIVLRGGQTFDTDTENMQAGDTYGASDFVVIERLEAA